MLQQLRERVARILAPELKGDAEIRAIVSEEIVKARMGLPATVNYDPNNEGYRRMSDSGSFRRDLLPMQQSRMFEIAYSMFDISGMFRRLAILDKTFMFAGKISISSDDDAVLEILNRFWKDPENNMSLNYPDLAQWLSILGEQCLPVIVNPYNGHVRLGYEDPSLIKDVYVNPLNVRQVMQVEMMGLDGRAGRKYAAIRKDYNISSKTYDRLVGDCFFFSINHPPNSPRGRSDFLTLFDWIDALERYGYNYLERAEFMLNFVWDITLKGQTPEQIKDWMRDNPPPQPGSIRAHNENVTWDAVSPDFKSTDYKAGFDMGKQFVMGAAGRPDSWFGAGGKAYQTEADLFGQVPIADLESRQEYHKFNLEMILQYVIDQAVLADVLPAAKAAAGFTVTMPEISKKDLAKMVNGIPQLATALAVAVSNKWVSRDTATRIFAFCCSYLGYEVDPEKEIEEALKATPDNEVDYEKMARGES